MASDWTSTERGLDTRHRLDTESGSTMTGHWLSTACTMDTNWILTRHRQTDRTLAGVKPSSSPPPTRSAVDLGEIVLNVIWFVLLFWAVRPSQH